jgi:hypothetical protein
MDYFYSNWAQEETKNTKINEGKKCYNNNKSPKTPKKLKKAKKKKTKF